MKLGLHSRVAKQFLDTTQSNGLVLCTGYVLSVDAVDENRPEEVLYLIRYNDGDEEHVDEKEFR